MALKAYEPVSNKMMQVKRRKQVKVICSWAGKRNGKKGKQRRNTKAKTEEKTGQ